MQRIAALSLALVVAGCGSQPCGLVGGDRVERLVAQLEGKCCSFHTEPVEGQLDDQCKAHDRSTWGMRWLAGRPTCAKWAAQCLGQMGGEAAASVPALVEALDHGPNNFDTGDGIVPARDAVMLALGRIGDPRAVGPLLQALRNPRPVDVGPGAVGYASSEPVGEAAALEALGMLGSHAALALPDVIEFATAPLETPGQAERYRAATLALAGIGDPAGTAVLIRGLEDPRRRSAAARALATMGEAAEGAGPALVALVEDAPDGEANAVLRRAIREILGQEAVRALPRNYDQQMVELMRHIDATARRLGCSRQRVSIHGAAEQLVHRLDDDIDVRVHFDRAQWLARRVTAGSLTLMRNEAELDATSFDSLSGLTVALDGWLESHCGKAAAVF
jgi:HEAT repeat protein